MSTVLLVLFLLVTLALIGVILVQRSEGGGLGIGSSQGMGSFMTGRGTANLLTRTTAILGTAFMALALVLAMLGKGQAPRGSILDAAPPAATAPAVPVAPAAPSVPNN
jgi:preprotein translocase subunit SecG